MGSSIIRRFPEKAISGIREADDIFRSWRPYLIVPPLFDDSGNVANNFRCVVSGGEFSLPKKRSGTAAADIKHLEVVGESRGCLALYNRVSHHIYTLNPINGHLVNLPPLPDPDRHFGGVSRLAFAFASEKYIRSFPIRRAMMIYGGGKKLAFCVPGTSKEWTPCIRDVDDDAGGREYEDVVHVHTDLFACLRKNPSDLEWWNLEDPDSGRTSVSRITAKASLDPRPRIHRDLDYNDEWLDLDRRDFPWPCGSEKDGEVKKRCWRIKYLASNKYVVVRHVMLELDHHPYKYKTIDFDVYAMDAGSTFRYMKADLDGHAIFVGNNESRAVAVRGPLYSGGGCKPDCIYFNDDNRLMNMNLNMGGAASEDSTMAFSITGTTLSNPTPIVIWITPIMHLSGILICPHYCNISYEWRRVIQIWMVHYVWRNGGSGRSFSRWDSLLLCSWTVPSYVTCSNTLACSEVREFEYRSGADGSIGSFNVNGDNAIMMNLYQRFELILRVNPLEVLYILMEMNLKD